MSSDPKERRDASPPTDLEQTILVWNGAVEETGRGGRSGAAACAHACNRLTMRAGRVPGEDDRRKDEGQIPGFK